MKHLKKICLMFLAISLMSITISYTTISNITSNVNADAKSASNNGKTATFTGNEVLTENLYGVYHEINDGSTNSGGATYSQYINEFEMKTDGVSSKLVTWAVQNSETHYVRKTIKAAAKDYEENHPGWIVVAGTNADQYFFSYGTKIAADGSAIYQPSPYYPMITDGEFRFTVTQAYDNTTNIVGFTNDGSTNSLVNPNCDAGNFQLTILDEDGNELATYPVNNINKNAGTNETSVWISPFKTTSSAVQYDVNPITCTTSNNIYVVSKAELCYLGNSSLYGYEFNATDTMFGRGTIDNITTGSYSFSKAQFGIETSNSDLINALDKGVRIRVEQLFTDEDLNNCDEGIGYHTCHKKNGVETTGEGSYNLQHYSRSLVGKKADGTYVLITADYVASGYKDGKKSQGLTFDECNAVANYYGLTDMYQMDGGGSVTALMRQADGTFKITNYPKDSGNPDQPREDYSFLFFVVRDSGVKVDSSATTYHSITLVNNTDTPSSLIKNVKVTVDGKTLDYTNGMVIDGLKDETEYKVTFNYDVDNDGTLVHNSYDIYVTTEKYKRPGTPIILETASKNSLTFQIREDVGVEISNIVVYLGSTSYAMGSNNQYTIDELLEDQEYDFYATYIVTDPVTGMKYDGVTNTEKVKTLAYERPVIEKFGEYKKEDGTLQIEYKYSDDDSVVTESYILCNGEKTALTRTSGKAKFEDLDFTNTDYTFKLVLKYADGKVESEELKYTHTGSTDPDPGTGEGGDVTPTPSDNTTKKKCGKKSMVFVLSLIGLTSSIALILRKKH